MDDSSSEYGRPRRPKPETVSYLNGLPLDETVATQQAREYVAYYNNNNLSKNNTDGRQEADDDDDEPPEYPPMLSAAHAALSSVFHEFASLACEEIPSQQLETLVRICCRYSLVSKRIILASIASYWTFLSTHRFGSHVAQTVLRCVVAETEVNLDDFDDGQGNEMCEGKMVVEDSYGSLLQGEDGNEADVTQSLSQLLLQSIEELKQYATDLAVHVCGSHVLRTALCILSGVEFVDAFAPPGSTNKQGNISSEWESGVLAAARRGKLKDKKKKKKKKFNATADSEEKGSKTPQEVTVMKKMNMVSELQSSEFHNNAETLTDEIVAIISMSSNEDGNDDGKVQPPGQLQEHTCHPSAGPLLVQILRLLSHRDFQSQSASSSKKMSGSDKKEAVPDRRLLILPQEPRHSAGSNAEALVHRLLCWDGSTVVNNDDQEASPKQPYAGDVIYGLSGEPRGSILLEAIFRCCSDSFHDELCTVGGFYELATLREYIQHGVSNFVIQTILMTVRNKEQTSRMVKSLCGIIEDGSILNAKEAKPNDGEDETEENKGKRKSPRMGVVWRTVEMCATKGSSQDQEQILSALLRGFATITNTNEESAEEIKSDEKKRKKRSKAKGLPVQECIPHLLGLAPGTYSGEGDNSRLTIDASGARTLHHILQFKERLRKDWVDGVLNIYSTDDIVKIANDGLGSRW